MAEHSSFAWMRPDKFMWTTMDASAPIAVFGAPLDETTSFRPGARFGPSATREASHALETYSLRQKRSLNSDIYVDIGDLVVPFDR